MQFASDLMTQIHLYTHIYAAIFNCRPHLLCLCVKLCLFGPESSVSLASTSVMVVKLAPKTEIKKSEETNKLFMKIELYFPHASIGFIKSKVE